MRQSDPFAEAALRQRTAAKAEELLSASGGSRLAENILFFARTLRAAGLPVGPGKMLDAVEAAVAVGVDRRDDFYWALHAVFVNRQDQREIFDQAFHVFWRNPKFLDRMRGLLLPQSFDEGAGEEDRIALQRRVAEALRGNLPDDRGSEKEEEEIEVDATLTWSERETIRQQDFEQMTSDEVARAKRIIAGLRLPIAEVPVRRWRRSATAGRVDPRASQRSALRSGGDLMPLVWRKRRRRHPPLVVLCDISGSMGRYSRLLLHFMHAVTNDRDRVHSFLFGTRLTNITRALRAQDVDLALEQAGALAQDWSGGTRIGACLAEFNRVWGRRVLGQGAVVLLISDGLDREAAAGLEKEMERLHKSCRRLIWLNPLLRYDAYAPKSQGARAMMPHVDDFRPVHNLDSLADLAAVLSRPPLAPREDLARWIEKARA
mgnify:CR=1 FL=1